MNWQFFERLAEHRMTPTVRSVGLVLAIRAKRDDPTCNPSIRNICRYASVGTQGAVTAIRKLQELDLVEVEKRRGQNNTYKLRTVLLSKTPTVLEPRTPRNSGKSAKCSTQQNTECESVLLSKTPPFYSAKTEREYLLNPFLVQGSDVMGVPY